MNQSSDGHVYRALTIAGSDSGGGAGIQADLKTLHQFGVYGMSVITALTAQNTLGVQGVYEVSSAFVRQQLESVFRDIGVDAMKTGMLATAEIIQVVAGYLCEVGVPNVVVDPVMMAKGGSPLLEPSAVHSLCNQLLPCATVVTPNLPEAEVLCGYTLASWDDCHRAAIDIARLGPKVVIIKGGHMPTDWPISTEVEHHMGRNIVVDLVYAEGTFTYFATERVNSQNTHGTGCTYSAALTAMMAQGAPLFSSIASAKAFVFGAVNGACDWDVGHGHGPTDHSASVANRAAVEAGGFYGWRNGGWKRIERNRRWGG